MLLKAVHRDSRLKNELLTAERVVDNEPPQADWHEAPYFIIHPTKFPAEFLDLILEESGGTKALRLLPSPENVVDLLGSDRDSSRELGQHRLRNIVQAEGLPIPEELDLAAAVRLRDEVKRAVQHRLGPRMDYDYDMDYDRYWVRVSRPTAQLYMGALAAVAAAHQGLAVATDAPGISAWADAACLTALISRGYGFATGPLPRLGLRIDPRSGDLDVAPRPMAIPAGVVTGESRALLARLTAETLSVAPDTTVRKRLILCDSIRWQQRKLLVYPVPPRRVLVQHRDVIGQLALLCWPVAVAAPVGRHEVRPEPPDRRIHLPHDGILRHGSDRQQAFCAGLALAGTVPVAVPVSVAGVGGRRGRVRRRGGRPPRHRGGHSVPATAPRRGGSG